MRAADALLFHASAMAGLVDPTRSRWTMRSMSDDRLGGACCDIPVYDTLVVILDSLIFYSYIEQRSNETWRKRKKRKVNIDPRDAGEETRRVLLLGNPPTTMVRQPNARAPAPKHRTIRGQCQIVSTLPQSVNCGTSSCAWHIVLLSKCHCQFTFVDEPARKPLVNSVVMRQITTNGKS